MSGKVIVAEQHASFATVAVGFVAMFFGFGVPVAAGAELPFMGSWEGVTTVTPIDPPFGTALIEGTGSATQLGQFTVEVPHVINFATRTATGSYEFTAANGDKLTADFNGTASPADAVDVLSILETATITGGTGRFAGAAGSFTSQRLLDTVSGLTTSSFEGTISVIPEPSSVALLLMGTVAIICRWRRTRG